MKVGVLALQGDFAEHIRILDSLKVQTIEVRTPADLELSDRLIIPGGESTTISKLLKIFGLFDNIQKRARAGHLPIYGTCAGAILLAKTVTGKNPPPTLTLIDISIERNAYGRQLESFSADIHVNGWKKPLPSSFIRAPIIRAVSPAVAVLASVANTPVLVRQERMLASTFHTEVRSTAEVHKFFLTL